MDEQRSWRCGKVPYSGVEWVGNEGEDKENRFLSDFELFIVFVIVIMSELRINSEDRGARMLPD